jgi:hypothetical protein
MSEQQEKKVVRRNVAILFGILCIMLALSLLVLSIPLVTIARLHVTIGQDTILAVSGQTIKVSLISIYFGRPTPPTGVYAIEVWFQNANNPIFVDNVTIGQYNFDLLNQPSGKYAITVYLIKNGSIIDTLRTSVTF